LLAHKVAADDNIVLDDGLAGENDVRGAMEEGAAGDFVAGVLQRGGVTVRMVIGKGMVESHGWENVQSRCIRRERRFSAAC
jgi:hypothetical protein